MKFKTIEVYRTMALIRLPFARVTVTYNPRYWSIGRWDDLADDGTKILEIGPVTIYW